MREKVSWIAPCQSRFSGATGFGSRRLRGGGQQIVLPNSFFRFRCNLFQHVRVLVEDCRDAWFVEKINVIDDRQFDGAVFLGRVKRQVKFGFRIEELLRASLRSQREPARALRHPPH